MEGLLDRVGDESLFSTFGGMSATGIGAASGGGNALISKVLGAV